MPSIPRGRALVLTSLFVLVVAACANEPEAAYAQTPQPQQPPPPPPPAGEYYAPGDGSQAEEVTVGSDGETYEDTDPSALTDFHSTLDSHGAWVDDPTYGQIWVPNSDEVGPDFAPYVSEGSWAYDDDYVWMSNYDWGWVPFHYGRWAWAGGRWGWIPGRVYSGAWVSWRVGPEGYGYCGWGPMAPAFGWHGGVAYGLGAEITSRRGPVVFVPRDGLFGPRVGARVVVGPRLGTIAAETHPFGRAEAGPAGHPISQGVMHGPAPASLGIQASAVVHVDPTNPSVARAKAFAHPSSAQAAGAHAPSAHKVRVRRASGAAPASGERSVERVDRNEGERPAQEQRRAAPPPAAAPPPNRGGARTGGGHGGRR